MPNWCNNILRISGSAADVESFKAQAVGHSPWQQPVAGAEPEVLQFHRLVPIPEAVLKAGYQAAGYDWERDQWGCKWGACDPELVEEWDGCAIYKFDTAWSPPLGFLEQLAIRWPTLTFILEYEEGGMGFKGLARAQANSIQDHCISL